MAKHAKKVAAKLARRQKDFSENMRDLPAQGLHIHKPGSQNLRKT